MALEYKLSYTGQEIDEKLGKVDNIVNQIIDPDTYPLSTSTGTVSVDFVMQVGGLNSTTGEESEDTTHSRSDFMAVTTDSGTIYSRTEWPETLRLLSYDANKNFIEKQYIDIGEEFSISSDWAYIRFYTDLTDTQFYFVSEGSSAIKAEFKKIYVADHGYSIYGAEIDDETMHKVVIEAEGKDGNSYNITEIKAPESNPEEATLALMNKGNGHVQFVDFSSMVYNPDKPTVEIVCQTRGDRLLPEFSIRYNNGKGAGRVGKFTVTPDCIPIKLTSTGIEVRRNNNYDNDATDEELVTVNLADLYDKVNTMTPEAVRYTAQTLTDDQKEQARKNIGIGVVETIDLTNFPASGFTEIVDGETIEHTSSYDESTGILTVDGVTIKLPIEEAT